MPMEISLELIDCFLMVAIWAQSGLGVNNNSRPPNYSLDAKAGRVYR